MDRLEEIRMEADRVIMQLNQGEQKFAFIHLYAVSQFAAMLALMHHADTELCQVAAMLHDIAVYANNVPQKNHAQKSALLAKEMLIKNGHFSEEEITTIVHAIAVHSDKQVRDDTVCAEILKDADVLAHYLYNPKIPMSERDQVRLYYLLETLQKEKWERNGQQIL